MEKFFRFVLGVYCWAVAVPCYATEKFEILPDLPEALSQAAQASTVSRGDNNVSSVLGPQTVSGEPNILTVVFSLIFVILLIYATGIIYTKLNKFGAKTLKQQQGELLKSQVAVVSTTPLGSNKTLHVVELDGKRMLIGASSSNIQLIKDLGNASACAEDDDEKNYSHIEIPNIKIPKIEIPKIEIPSVNFSKLMTKSHKNSTEHSEEKEDDIFNSDDIEPKQVIEKLFPEQENITAATEQVKNPMDDHVVDPDEYALYRKYINK